jgi:hypothetical protein
MSDFLKARYEKDPSIVYREIAGEVVLVPIRRNVADMDSIYTLSDVGLFIWGLIDGQKTVGQILNEVLQEYDISSERASVDLDEFLTRLHTIGAIKSL